MGTVSKILKRKGNSVITVTPDASVMNALKLMAEKNIGSVVVMDGDNLLGIMTERDYSRKVALKGRNSEHTTVADIMSSEFPAVSLTDEIDHCMQLMSSRNIRYLPVMEEEKLVGILSINDIVTQIILNQKETISQLQSYIQS